MGTFLLLGLILISVGISSAQKASTTPTLTIYMFEQFVSVPEAETTNIVSAFPSGNSSAFQFGNIGVAQHILRETESSTSKVIGRKPGYFIPTRETGSFNVMAQLTLETEKYNGTLVVSGDFDLFAPVNEFAVLGGTTSFRFAQGYSIVTTLELTPLIGRYRWDFYLRWS